MENFAEEFFKDEKLRNVLQSDMDYYTRGYFVHSNIETNAIAVASAVDTVIGGLDSTSNDTDFMTGVLEISELFYGIRDDNMISELQRQGVEKKITALQTLADYEAHLLNFEEGQFFKSERFSAPKLFRATDTYDTPIRSAYGASLPPRQFGALMLMCRTVSLLMTMKMKPRAFYSVKNGNFQYELANINVAAKETGMYNGVGDSIRTNQWRRKKINPAMIAEAIAELAEQIDPLRDQVTDQFFCSEALSGQPKNKIIRLPLLTQPGYPFPDRSGTVQGRVTCYLAHTCLALQYATHASGLDVVSSLLNVKYPAIAFFGNRKHEKAAFDVYGYPGISRSAVVFEANHNRSRVIQPTPAYLRILMKQIIDKIYEKLLAFKLFSPVPENIDKFVLDANKPGWITSSTDLSGFEYGFTKEMFEVVGAALFPNSPLLQAMYLAENCSPLIVPGINNDVNWFDSQGIKHLSGVSTTTLTNNYVNAGGLAAAIHAATGIPMKDVVRALLNRDAAIGMIAKISGDDAIEAGPEALLDEVLNRRDKIGFIVEKDPNPSFLKRAMDGTYLPSMLQSTLTTDFFSRAFTSEFDAIHPLKYIISVSVRCVALLQTNVDRTAVLVYVRLATIMSKMLCLGAEVRIATHLNELETIVRFQNDFTLAEWLKKIIDTYAESSVNAAADVRAMVKAVSNGTLLKGSAIPLYASIFSDRYWAEDGTDVLPGTNADLDIVQKELDQLYQRYSDDIALCSQEKMIGSAFMDLKLIKDAVDFGVRSRLTLTDSLVPLLNETEIDLKSMRE